MISDGAGCIARIAIGGLVRFGIGWIGEIGEEVRLIICALVGMARGLIRGIEYSG